MNLPTQKLEENFIYPQLRMFRLKEPDCSSTNDLLKEPIRASTGAAVANLPQGFYCFCISQLFVLLLLKSEVKFWVFIIDSNSGGSAEDSGQGW